MQFDLVTPERKLASMDVNAVQIPGADGDMTALPDHAPVLTSLRPGVVSVESASGTDDYVVTGGFAEVSPEGTSILAEQAVPKAEATREMIEAVLEDARAALETATDDTRTVAAQRVNDLGELLNIHFS